MYYKSIYSNILRCFCAISHTIQIFIVYSLNSICIVSFMSQLGKRKFRRRKIRRRNFRRGTFVADILEWNYKLFGNMNLFAE